MPPSPSGFYRATVIDNEDPAARFRIKIQCLPLFGTGVTNWIDACLPVGSTAAPDVGTAVWIGFQAGDINHPIWIGLAP